MTPAESSRRDRRCHDGPEPVENDFLQTAAQHDSWPFAGCFPGEHINASHLADELRHHGSLAASRTGTWQQFVREILPSILADAIGISPTTGMKHAPNSQAPTTSATSANDPAPKQLVRA